MHMNPALVLKNISVSYKDKRREKEAVRNLSLEINFGEIFGFLGPNGAGKTTTIKVILNLIYPKQGEILIFGKTSKDYRLRQRIGYMPEVANYYWYLNPRELLLMYAGFFGITRKAAEKKIDELFNIVGLQGEDQVLMKNFSKGMMQKVNLAQALINDPDLLILDEPTSGLDPIARMKVRDIIYQLKKKGKTIFFSSHELSEVELVSDRVGVLKNGLLIKAEKIDEILHRKGEEESLENYFFRLITQG